MKKKELKFPPETAYLRGKFPKKKKRKTLTGEANDKKLWDIGELADANTRDP